MNIVTKKKLTVMLDAEVYEALREKVGERGIGVFLSNLARPYVMKRSLDDGYRAMAMDIEHEAHANEWIQSDVEVSDTENVWQF